MHVVHTSPTSARRRHFVDVDNLCWRRDTRTYLRIDVHRLANSLMSACGGAFSGIAFAHRWEREVAADWLDAGFATVATGRNVDDDVLRAIDISAGDATHVGIIGGDHAYGPVARALRARRVFVHVCAMRRSLARSLAFAADSVTFADPFVQTA